MPIPELVSNVLPEGVHDCTMDDIEAVFGRFQRSDRRMRLAERLRAYLADARRAGVVRAVVVDGSFVTAKDEPEDVDLIVVVPADWDFDAALKPFVYNVVTKAGVKRAGYPFDAFLRAEGSEEYDRLLAFFMTVTPDKYAGFTSRSRKGVLRVTP